MRDDNSYIIESSSARALIISPDQKVSLILELILSNGHWEVDTCERLSDFERLAKERVWSFVIIVEKAGCDLSQNILGRLQSEIKEDRTQVVVLTQTPSASEAMFCFKLGAADYCSWPMMPSEVLELADRARRQTRNEIDDLIQNDADGLVSKENISELRVMIGGSRPMLQLSREIFKVTQDQNHAVFIIGETGTGKEVVARQIHEMSGRMGPFRAINCAAMVENLIESELFGHEKGAFTGAYAMKKGLWEEAAQGTIFLDEITEASPSIQSKLLRVLQEGTIRRVGSNHDIKVTARVIAASNRNIEKAIKEGSFREDLFYRLNQVVRVPPLRERVEDIPLLAAYFCQCSGKRTIITPEAMDLFCRYDWPGNVRELESVINKLTTFCGRRIYPDDVLLYLRPSEHRIKTQTRLFLLGLMNASSFEDWPSLQDIKKTYAVEAFNKLGKEFQVAKVLGIDYRTVVGILKKEPGYRLLTENGRDPQPGNLFSDDDQDQTVNPTE
jgi:DNA-binding NtrC family response regulator